MLEDWEEINIGSAHKNGLLARAKEIQNKVPEEPVSWTPISPIETVLVDSPPKKNYKFKVFIVTVIFIILQLFIFFFTDQIFEEKKKKDNYSESSRYLDLAYETISNESERIISEIKQFHKTRAMLADSNEKNFESILFPSGTNHLYFGVYSNQKNKLVLEEQFFNEILIGKIPFDPFVFKEILDSNEINILRSGDGNPYIHNLSIPGIRTLITLFSIPLPDSKFALLAVDTTHWSKILSKPKQGTLFLLNDINAVISDSDLDVALTGPDYAELEFLKFILLDKPHNITKQAPTKAGKTLQISVRKIIQTDSYLIYLAEEYNQEEILHPETSILYISSCIIFLFYAVTLVFIMRRSIAI